MNRKNWVKQNNRYILAVEADGLMGRRSSPKSISVCELCKTYKVEDICLCDGMVFHSSKNNVNNTTKVRKFQTIQARAMIAYGLQNDILTTDDIHDKRLLESWYESEKDAQESPRINWDDFENNESDSVV